jgi:hypothetical protein
MFYFCRDSNQSKREMYPVDTIPERLLLIPTGVAFIDDNLHWLILLAGVLLFAALRFLIRKMKYTNLSAKQKVRVEIGKSRLYYPEYITLTITNTGSSDIDIDRPMLVFDNWWLKRKFRISGVEGRSVYPLYLEKGKTHSLSIDLSPFYGYDRKLKGYPKVNIVIYNVKGKYLGKHSVFLRKTFFKF